MTLEANVPAPSAAVPATSRRAWPALIVRCAGLWVLIGALAKLFLGTPKDLPAIVRDMSPFDWDLTFHVVIAVELVIVSCAMLKPRLAWPVLVALFAFFDFILTRQLAAGAESCGCFGATIKVSPYLMLAVDSVLLVAMLASRPWTLPRDSRTSTWVMLLAVCASIALPWIVIGDQSVQPTAPANGGAAAPPVVGRWIELKPKSWVGQSIYDVKELATWVPAEKLPTDGKIVLWRQGCSHCAAHLRKLAQEDDGSQAIVLIQARDDLANSREVDALPKGAHVTEIQLPENKECLFQTPMEIRIEGGVVTSAVLAEDEAK